MKKYRHITLNDRVYDVMRHPAFEGFGPRLFSWNDYQNRAYPEKATMRETLNYDLWLTHSDPQRQVDGLNRLIDDVNAGETVFYDIYTEEEKAKDSYKNYTGLTFFRGKPGAPFMIFVLSGGYVFVAMLHEGLPIAKIVSEHGYNAFVLRYRVDMGGRYPIDYQRPAGLDLIRAVQFIQQHADELQVDKENYSLWGGSAGAHTVSDVVYGEAGVTQKQRLFPAAAVIAYTYFSDDIDFKSSESPAYFIVGKQDGIAPWSCVAERARKMKAAGCTVEEHIINQLGHGFGVGRDTPAAGWVEQAIAFWERNMTGGKR